MFCPKCGTENPETGRFCRSCGTDLGNVSQALNRKPDQPRHLVNHKGKRISWDSAMSKLFMGFGFLVVSMILGITGAGRNWWFWLLVPAFAMIGSGIAQYIQLKKTEAASGAAFVPNERASLNTNQPVSSLPPTQTEFIPADASGYKTGDLVPPSVTDNTTRQLEMNDERETMTLPKN